MSLTMEGITTDQYRQAAKELHFAMKNTTTTYEQCENGFKCLTLMYLALREDKEFGADLIVEVKRLENQQVMLMMTKQRVQWLIKNNYPLIQE